MSKPPDLEAGVPKAELVTVCTADVVPQPVRWIWPDRIAAGKLSIVAGDAGLGKSLLTCDMAARVSTGRAWPVDGSPCEAGSVLLLSAEDDVADTIRPRLDAAGADPRRVHAVTAVREAGEHGDGADRLFSLRQDVAKLKQKIGTISDCQLVVIDPLSAYLDGTDSHRTADVRGLLAPLADVASSTKVAIVGVLHLNKGGHPSALHRVSGSVAFGAAARVVLLVAKDPDDASRRLVLPAKNNLASDLKGLAYRVAVDDGRRPYIEWEPEPVDVAADDVLATVNDKRRTPGNKAVTFLKQILADGSVLAKDVQAAASEAGISEHTLNRAKAKLRVASERDRETGRWYWVPPPERGAQEREHCQGCQSP